MNLEYYNAVVAMEKAGADADFVEGWQSGYLLNQAREEQRLNEAYEAGFAAGTEHDMDAYKEWVKG